MKELPLILTLHASVLSAFIWLASPACADSGTDYKAGSDFAKQVQGSGMDSLKNFSGEQNLPGYTDSPEQTKYYGGVTASGDSALKGDSAAEFSQGETGKTITESFTNRPPDLVSPEAPFIQSAKDIESRRIRLSGIPARPVRPRWLTAANSRTTPVNATCRSSSTACGRRPLPVTITIRRRQRCTAWR